MHVERILAELGGIASKWQLNERGATDWEIGRARHSGRILRIRRAWYALLGTPADVCTAVRVGGMLSCVSLLRSAGVWTPRVPDAVHVSVAANASRLRSATSRSIQRAEAPEGVVLHWRPRGATTTARDTIAGALAAMATCEAEEAVLAATDSAVRQGLVAPIELRSSGLPPSVLRRVDARAESGGESVVRRRLVALHLAFRSQVFIHGVGRVDFLIGDRLALEVDGYSFHGDRETFERDRARDLALVSLGYLVIRVSYRQIEEWDRVARAIIAIVRSRRHYWPRHAA